MSGLNINTNTGGKIGHVESWSMEVDATPIILGDTSPGAGGLSLAAAAGDDIEFLHGTELSASTASWTMAGPIESISVSEGEAGVSAGGAFSVYISDFDIPPVPSGSPAGSIDMLSQIVHGSRGTCSITDEYAYWSLAGHDTGFGSDGKMSYPVSMDRPFIYTHDEDQNIQAVGRRANAQFAMNGSFFFQWKNTVTAVNELYCGMVTGPSLPPIPELQHFVAVHLNGQQVEPDPFVFNLVTGPDSALASTGKNCTLTIDRVLNTISMSVDYRNAGVSTNYSTSQSIAALNFSDPIILLICIEYLSGTSFAMSARIQNVGEPAGSITVSSGSLSTAIDLYSEPFTIRSGLGFRDMFIGSTPTSTARGDIIAALAVEAATSRYVIDDTAPQPNNIPIAGVTGQGWEYLKNVAAGTLSAFTAHEAAGLIKVKGGIGNTYELRNTLPGLSEETDDARAAKTVRVKNYHAENVDTLFRLYDAIEADESWGIGVNETKTVIIDIGHFPNYIQGPIPVSRDYDQTGQ